MSVIFSLVIFQSAQAAKSDNVYGWAWSEDIGWISFNNINCDTDSNGRIDGGDNAPLGCPANGTIVAPYGVTVDMATGEFFGHAWSEYIGWISFNRNETGAPPAPPYNGIEPYIAKLDWNTNEVSGWARVLSVVQNPLQRERGGWDGWIKFRGANYGVWLDKSVDPAEFRDFAWADQFPVVGWISFNSKNCDPDKNGFSNGTVGCPALGTPVGDYKVMISAPIPNNPPSAKQLKANIIDPCNYGTSMLLSWKFEDDDPGDWQSYYWIQIDDNSDFLSLADEAKDIPTEARPNGKYSYRTAEGKLKFNLTYYWRLKVRDNHGLWSDWIYPPASLIPPGESFRTPDHAYPNVSFFWIPFGASVDDFVNFFDTSAVYSTDGPGSPGISRTVTDCGSDCNRDWTFEDGTPAKAETEIVNVKFDTPGYKTVTLTITDQDENTCFKSVEVKIAPPLPRWKEIAPYTWLRKFFATVSSSINSLIDNLKHNLFASLKIY